MNKVILLYHHRKSVKTIEDFIKEERINTITAKDLFDQNKEFIFSQMTMEDKNNFKAEQGTYPNSANDLVVGMTLPCPCKLKINPKDVTAEIVINQTNLQADTDDFFAFENEQIQEIVQEEPYSANVDRRVPTCQVIGWFKSLYAMNKTEYGYVYRTSGNYKQFKNLTQDVLSIQTNVGKNGGNFTIRLPHISFSRLGLKTIFTENKESYFDWEYLQSQDRNRDFVTTNNEKFGGDNFIRNDFASDDYYSTLISNNDLFFISYYYNDNNYSENNFSRKFFEGKNKYDMIGLVDSVRIVKNPQGSDISIEVSGRDLMKLLIEDGTYFFNPSVVADYSRIFWNVSNLKEIEKADSLTAFQKQNAQQTRGDIMSTTKMGDTYNPLQRMIGARDIADMINVFAHRQNMKIDFILKAVISQLSNIQVVPGYIFDGFPNRTTFNEIKPKEEE